MTSKGGGERSCRGPGEAPRIGFLPRGACWLDGREARGTRRPGGCLDHGKGSLLPLRSYPVFLPIMSAGCQPPRAPTARLWGFFFSQGSVCRIAASLVRTSSLYPRTWGWGAVRWGSKLKLRSGRFDGGAYLPCKQRVWRPLYSLVAGQARPFHVAAPGAGEEHQAR